MCSTKERVRADQPISAKSGLVQVMQPNDGTEATLPDAELDDRSRSGPKLPGLLLPVNVRYLEAGCLWPAILLEEGGSQVEYFQGGLPYAVWAANGGYI
jgi:hypothetical protein